MKIFIPIILIAILSLTSLNTLNSLIVSEVVDGDTFSLLILNKPVILREEKLEKYGRKMALVYLLDGVLINKVMMEEGFGRPDYRENSQRGNLTAAFHEAKNNNRGLWSLV
jgi:endonuclease YncB( thermonuclease family)